MKNKKLISALVCLTLTAAASASYAAVQPLTENDIPSVPMGVRKTSNISNQVDSAIHSAQNRAQTQGAKTLKINSASRIVLSPGQNELIPIALNHTNRIVTPFRNPEVISTSLTGGSAKSGNCGEICVKGNVVYVSTDKTTPSSMFITEQGSEEQALSITMIPREIPPREVFLELPAGVQNRSNGSERAANDAVRQENYEAESFERSMAYVDTIRTMLREIALGKIPSGYSLGSVRGARNIPSCKQSFLKFDFLNGQRLTGHNLDVYVGTATNVGKETVIFDETSCGNWGSAAVATWPLHVLNPGQKTEVYVVMKEARKIIEAPERPFLIRPQFNNR